MYFKNILYSNFTFTEEEELLKFKFKMLNISLLTIAAITFFIALMSHLGVNDIGVIQMLVNYIHSLSAVILFFLLRISREQYGIIATSIIIITFLNVESALIFVTADEFRMMWFIIAMYLTFILKGSKAGIFSALFSIVAIIVSDIFFEIQLSSLAVFTAIYGLIIGSLLMYSNTNKIHDYEASMYAKNEQLTRLTSVDHLTGIMNKNTFLDLSSHYFKTARLHNEELHILIMKLERFRELNEIYGHKVGDLILLRFVEVVHHLLSENAVFARVDGAAFMVLLYNSDLQTATKLSEQIQKAVEAIIIAHDHEQIQTAICIGLASRKEDDASIGSVIARAEKALFEALEKEEL